MQRNVAVAVVGALGFTVGLVVGPIAGLVGSAIAIVALVLGGVGALVAALATSDSESETVVDSSERMTELEE